MKAAFFHDAPLMRNQDGQMYSLGFPYSLWERYLTLFDELVVSTRCYFGNLSEDRFRGFQLSGGDRVHFKPITAYNSGLDVIKNYNALKAQVRETLLKVDCAIIRLPSIIGWVACQEAIRLRKPWAVEVVACIWDGLWNHGSIKGKIAAPILFLLNRYFIGKSTHAIYVSNEFLQKRYPSFGVVEGCSDVNIESPTEEVLKKRLAKIDAGLEGRQVIFGLIGSLNVGFKGHETAMKALASVKNEIGDFKLCFLGGGKTESWERMAEKLGIRDNVVFCGTLPSGKPVLEWIDNIDIYLIPSLQEGLPRALVEALSRGCPSLGAITGGIPELLPVPFLHKKKDWRKLGNDIVKITKNKKLLSECAINGFNISLRFTREELDEKREGFWKRFISEVQVLKNTNGV